MLIFQRIRVRRLPPQQQPLQQQQPPPQQQQTNNSQTAQRVKIICKDNLKYEVAQPQQPQQPKQQQPQQLSGGGALPHHGAPVPADLPATFNPATSTQSTLAGQTTSPPPPPPRAVNKANKDFQNAKQAGNGREGPPPMSNHAAAVAQLATLQRYQQPGNSGLPGGHHHHHHHHYHSYHQVFSFFLCRTLFY